MTHVAQVQPRSVVADMAQRFGQEPAAFVASLKATVMPPNVSDAQFAAFLLVAKQYGLNPLTREVWAFPAKGGGIIPVVSIDGWMRIINDHPAMDGMRFLDHREDGALVSITCEIFRKDRAHPVSVTEYLAECRRQTEPWKQWPARMLRHKSAIQAARYAFGFSGIYDQDEAERMAASRDAGLGAPTQPKPTAAAAKRSGVWEEMIGEINACQTLHDLEAWWSGAEARIASLPNTMWADAVRDAYERRQDALSGWMDDAAEAAEGQHTDDRRG